VTMVVIQRKIQGLPKSLETLYIHQSKKMSKIFFLWLILNVTIVTAVSPNKFSRACSGFRQNGVVV
jgi:hypothetical protein